MEKINILKYLTIHNIAETIIALLLVALVYTLIRNGIKAKSKKVPLYLLSIFVTFIILSFYKTLLFPYFVSCGLIIFCICFLQAISTLASFQQTYHTSMPHQTFSSYHVLTLVIWHLSLPSSIHTALSANLRYGRSGHPYRPVYLYRNDFSKYDMLT